MVQRVMKEAWADDDELGWAGLGWGRTGWQQKGQAADGTDCTRQVLHHTPGAVLGPACTALPCRTRTRTSRPWDTEVQTSAAGFPAARPARANRLQSMGQALGLDGA